MQAPALSALPGETINQLIQQATVALAGAGVGTPRLDAELLLAAASGSDRAALYARAADIVPVRWREALHAMLARRLAREPLQYIVGKQDFWSLDFMVTPDVLIPRPETELLVELTLRSLGAREQRRITLCDIGTGSGCIAIALACELPEAEIWAVDASPAALAVAEANARRHGVARRMHFVGGDLFESLVEQRFDVIVSNPPYVTPAEMARLQPEVRWEPRRALDGGDAGLEVIARLLAAAPAHLVEGGWMIMEIGASQEAAAVALAVAGHFSEAAVRRDYAGHPRVLVARR